MAGYGIRKATHTISLKPFDGSDNYVVIRGGRSYKQRLELSSSGFEVSSIDENGTPKINFDVSKARIALFKSTALSWTLTDEDGDLLPLDLDQLNADLTGTPVDEAGNLIPLGQWLIQRIEEYYQSRLTEDAVKNSIANSKELSPPMALFPTPSSALSSLDG